MGRERERERERERDADAVGGKKEAEVSEAAIIGDERGFRWQPTQRRLNSENKVKAICSWLQHFASTVS